MIGYLIFMFRANLDLQNVKNKLTFTFYEMVTDASIWHLAKAFNPYEPMLLLIIDRLQEFNYKWSH